MPLPRLSPQTLSAIHSRIAVPAYDRTDAQVGVVHFGPGAFHRAHQAYVFERLLAHDPRWAICGVSLRSTHLAEALTPQSGLYTLVEQAPEPTLRVIGSVADVVVAPQVPQAVMAALTAPQTRWVSLTITEKGYGFTPAGDLDVAAPQIAADLAGPAHPVSAIGWITASLAARRAAGLAPFVVASCDNLSGNGKRLRQGVLQFAAQRDVDLAAWIADGVRFPDSMVDSITPATDEPLRHLVAERLGLWDAAPVQREPFLQWVIDADLGPGAPDLAVAGVTLTTDVSGYEQAKLRLLNGAHSTLAYLGLLRGYETVAEAMSDRKLADFVAALMREDIALTVPAPSGLDIDAYVEAILGRFRNTAIRHRLTQIAMDGSRKLPFRLLATIEDALDAGRPVTRLAIPIAGWMIFLRRQALAGRSIDDPMAEALARAASGDEQGLAARFLALDSVFRQRLSGDPAFSDALEAALTSVVSTWSV